MGLASFMAALIFFLGGTAFNAAPVYAAVDMPGYFPSSSDLLRSHGEPASVADEENVAGPVLGFQEMILLHDAVRRTAGNRTRFVSAGDRAFFLGNSRLNAMDSFSEVFGYSDDIPVLISSSYRSVPGNFEDDRCTGTSKEISKSEIMDTLKEGMHHILMINPRYNPFLWKHLVKASLGRYSFGLDARLGSTMYVGPKITWSRNLDGWPVDTELKWVPLMRTTSVDGKGSYVMLKFRIKF